MRFYFEDRVCQFSHGGIRTAANGVFIAARVHAGRIAALENSRIVGVRNNSSFRMSLMRFRGSWRKSDLSFFSPSMVQLALKNLMTAVLGVSLSKHHELHVCGVTVQLGERINQVLDFVFI